MAKHRQPAGQSKRNDGRSRPGGDYIVGRGRPPVDEQWKPGQSGNKKGRKKGSKNRKTIVRKAECKTFTVQKAGRPRKMTIDEIGIHNLQQDILRGDRKAYLDWLEIADRYGDRSDATASMQELIAEDQAILENMMTRQARKSPKPSGDQR